MGYGAEGLLMKAVCETEERSYPTLARVLETHTPRGVLDIWLQYEGIIGYTDQILRAATVLGLINKDDIQDSDYISD